MSEEKNKKSSTILRILSPRHSMGQSLSLMKNQWATHKETRDEIRFLWQVVKKGLTTEKGVSFEQIVQQHGAPRIYRHYLLKKRISLLAGLVFGGLGVLALAQGNVFGLATLVAGVPLFFILALTAQGRIWQLEAEAYHEGLGYFMRRHPFWILDVLNPCDFSGKGGAE